jgi:hypothetical protein
MTLAQKWWLDWILPSGGRGREGEGWIQIILCVYVALEFLKVITKTCPRTGKLGFHVWNVVRA